jgi:hypothetical protein
MRKPWLDGVAIEAVWRAGVADVVREFSPPSQGRASTGMMGMTSKGCRAQEEIEAERRM